MRPGTLYPLILSLLGLASAYDAVTSEGRTTVPSSEAVRRVTVYSEVTGERLVTIRAKLALRKSMGEVIIRCNVGAEDYKEHYIGSLNAIGYIVEELEEVKFYEYPYKVTYHGKPQLGRALQVE